MGEARVRVSLSDGVLEFEGSENFVTGQVEKFTRIIQAALAGERPIADVAATGGGGGTTAAGSNGAGSETTPAAAAPPSPDVDLKDIFEATDTGVQILRPLPGSSKAQKAVNGAKLYLYGLRALKQRDTALFEEIKSVCKAHRCYDSHNMAACLKADQASFVFGGQGKRQTLKLSAPGVHATAELIARFRTRRQGIAPKRKGNGTRGNGIGAKRKGNGRDIVPTAPRVMGSSPRSMATLVKSPR